MVKSFLTKFFTQIFSKEKPFVQLEESNHKETDTVSRDSYGEKMVVDKRELPIAQLNQNSTLFLYNSINLSVPDFNQKAFIDEVTGQTMNYKQLLQYSKILAESLEKVGIKQNDVIAICSDNNIYIFVVVLAALYAGIPLTSINPAYLEHELLHAITLTEPKLVFVSKSSVEKFLNLKKKRTFSGDIIVIDSNEKIPQTTSLWEFIYNYLYHNHNEKNNNFRPRPVTAREHIALILFSSGTTGLPKGVMTTHYNVNARLIYELDPTITYHSKKLFTICVLPLFHAYGLQTGLGSIVLGKSMVLLQRFEPEQFLRTVEKYQVFHLPAVPTLMRFLAKSPLVVKYDLSCVEEITYGSAPAGEKLEVDLAERLNTSVRQGYGLTEVTLGVLANPVGQVKPGSVGKLYPGVECVVRDPNTGKNLGAYEHGEICVKGPNVMKGYYKNLEATINTFTDDGFLKTGDIGYYDKDEYFYIVDRLKELIKYKSFQVAPAELEAVLLSHPEIKDAVVVGVPDENAGELPMALVVKEPDSHISAKDVQMFVAGILSRNKHLHGGVVFVNGIPRNSTNKVSRKDVKEMAKAYLKSKL